MGTHEGPVGGAVLTRREREIVQLVGQALSNKEIGQRLFICEGTVKVHLHNVYRKLCVDGRLRLALLAQRGELS